MTPDPDFTRRLEFARFIHEYVRSHIASVDQKSTVVFGIAAALFAYVEQNGALSSLADLHALTQLYGFSGAVSALLLVVCATLALAVIAPRPKPRVPSGLIYWHSVLELTQEDHLEQVQALDDKGREEHLVRQFYVLSGLCARKYALLDVSLRVGLVAFAFVVLFTTLRAALPVPGSG